LEEEMMEELVRDSLDGGNICYWSQESVWERNEEGRWGK